MKKIIFNIYLFLLPILTYAIPNAGVQSVTFDKSQIIRGVEAVTATITIINTGNVIGTFYITASAQDIKSAWYDFTPIRTGITLSPGSTGSVQLIWSTGADVPAGICYFYMKVFKAATGVDFYTDYGVSKAFLVLSNTNPFPIQSGKIVYHNYSSYEAWDSKLYILNFSNNSKSEISKNWNIDHAMNAHFSNDGSKIVFMGVPKGMHQSSSWEVFLWDFISTNPVNLTNNSLRDEDPKFSPDNNTIVFKQNGDIKLMDLKGNILKNITNDGYVNEESMPFFTTDGKKIIYAKGAGLASDIYIIDISGINNKHLVYESNLQEYYPIIKDESSFFYTRWVSTSDHHDQIYIGYLNVNTPLSALFNNNSIDFSDPYPAGASKVFFSNTSSGNYDLYLGDLISGNTWSLNNFGTNSTLNELGVSYTPYSISKFLQIINPSNNSLLGAISQILLKVKAVSNNNVWADASITVKFIKNSIFEYGNLKDDGTSGDELENDGIYSKYIYLPDSIGNYSIVAEAVTFDNGIQSKILSDTIKVNIDKLLPEAFIIPSFLNFGSVAIENSKEMSFTLENIGNANLTGEVLLESPFSLSSGSPYNLIPGQTEQVIIKFTPTEETDYIKNITFSGAGNITRILQGSGVNGINDIGDYGNSQDIKIYPVPVKNTVSIEFDNGLNFYPEKIKIYSITGQLLFIDTFDKSSNRISIDISNLNTGVYYLSILLADYKIIHDKFIVE